MKLLLSLIIMIFIVAGCKDENKNDFKIYKTGLFGLSSVGKPQDVLLDVIIFIKNHKSANGKFPNGEIIAKKLLSKQELFFYYSFNATDFQIAYWSGETTWVYDSKTNAFYETTKDIAKIKWFDTIKRTPSNKEDINYVNLSSRKNKI